MVGFLPSGGGCLLILTAQYNAEVKSRQQKNGGERRWGMSPTPEELKAAFKAFKKRLKLFRLDHESRLSGSPLTGRSSHIAVIVPPTEHPPAVWDELVRQGKLKKLGGGTYGLAEEQR